MNPEEEFDCSYLGKKSSGKTVLGKLYLAYKL